MDSAIWCAIISGAVTLLVSIGTWQVSAKRDRDKTREDIRKTLDDNYKKTQSDIEDLKDDIASVSATVQNQVSILEVRLDTLTKTVEKHNQVIERTYKLEQAVDDLKQKWE